MNSHDTDYRTMKRAKLDTAAAGHILTLLDENSLLQVLLRTRSEDHNALWKTCRSFRNIIDSELFRQERAQQEWAQVKTKVWTADDHIRDATSATDDDDDDSEVAARFARDRFNELGCISDDPVGVWTNKFNIVVDGKIAGHGSYTLIKRSSHVNFHEVCDDVSQEILRTACLFFDSKGHPRLLTLKKAMAASSMTDYRHERRRNNYFLYLNTFTLNHPEYCRNATWVGANAIRSLLLDSPLKEKWEVVIYMANSRSTFTKEERERERSLRRELEKEENEQVLRETRELQDRLQSLAKDDLRPFLRCGFEQATNSVTKCNCLYVFAVPEFLGRPMLPHKQAMAMNIIDKKQLACNVAMSVEESKLLKFMVTSCIKRRSICQTLVSPSLTREEIGRQLYNETDLETNINPRERQATIEAAFQAFSAAHSKALVSAPTDLAKLDAEVKAEIDRVVGASKDGASIKNSNSIHACAAQMTPEYIDLLLSCVPLTERRSLLNMFDSNGLTPLMVTASAPRFYDKPELRFRMVERLIELGADKNIRDMCGETALGKFRDMKRSRSDLPDGFDTEEDQGESNSHHARMERLLRPFGGPTAADEACLDADYDESDDEEDEEFAEDDESDDEEGEEIDL